jgi:hypothetical protein
MPLGGQCLIADSADRLTRERGGQAGWCGPAAIALAVGCGYAEACALLRRVAPERYLTQPDIVTAYWRDVLEALRHVGQPAEPLPVTRLRDRGPTLLGLVRHGGLEPGLYLVRVGLAQVHDNRLSGAVLSVRSHGLCRVTHLARLPRGLA